jgi:pimeloyl-ACP methyl ester carboxylesterase
MKEDAVLCGEARSLVGIITTPSNVERSKSLPAVIFLSAGLLHRVGPNRLYVSTARKLAESGFVTLRLDFAGIGDSRVREDNIPFERSAVRDAQEAMDWLNATRGIKRFVLIGLCSGAYISLQTACRDQRVVGAVLINVTDYRQEVRDYFALRADTRYYWTRALFSAKSWVRLAIGVSRYRNIIAVMAFQLGKMLARDSDASSAGNYLADFPSLVERGVRLLLVHNEWDPGLEQLRLRAGDRIGDLSLSGKMRAEVIPHADHLFTPLRSQERLVEAVHGWMQTIT